MSKNRELILAGYEAWNRDDLDAWLETLHPDVELQTFSLTGRLRAKGADSGVAVDMRFAHALRVRDGLLARIVVRRTAEEAREELQRMADSAKR